MKENIVDTYYDSVSSDSNPGLVLTKLYSELTNLPFSGSNVAQFTKLVHLYGRIDTYRALIEAYESGANFSKGFYGLLSYICKKYRTDRNNVLSIASLEPVIEQRRQSIAKSEKQKLDIRSPFDE